MRSFKKQISKDMQRADNNNDLTLTASSNDEQIRTTSKEKGGRATTATSGYRLTSSNKRQKTSCDDDDTASSSVVPTTTTVGSSDEKQNTPTREGERTDASISGFLIDLGIVFSGLDQYYWASLDEKVTSKISKSVVSLLLFDGSVNVLACSGIPIESKTPKSTRLLTSEKLGITFLARRNAGHDMSIQVRDASNNVALGWLEQRFMDPGFTLVNVKQSLDVCTVHLNNEVEVLPGSNLLGIELTDSWGPTFIRGFQTEEDSSASEDGQELSASTCKISKAGDGGPLFDDNGNFVGMNLFLDTKRGVFMQRNIIIQKLEKFEKRIEWLTSKSHGNIQGRKHKELQRRIMSCTKDFAITNRDLLEEDLDSLGYPKPTAIDCGMVLVNSFEETFGDTCDSGKGVWGILKEIISKDLSQSVVSLATYNGEMRYFACSGIMIEWNGRTAILTSASLVRDPRDEFKIWDNLKIDVLLPDKQHTEGTLQHCHLHYNVAIVSFNSDRAFPTMSVSDDRSSDDSCKAVAVGRCFESGMLMATKGLQNQGHCQSLLDCDVLLYSSCEITKAGIGGPLTDFNGKFIGMNFYDEYEGTPFVPPSCVCKVLEHFEKKRFLAETDGDGYKNRWPVPMPYWCHQDPKKEKQERKERVGLLFRKESWAPPRRTEALPTC